MMNQVSRELEKKLAEDWTGERVVSLGDNVFGFAMTLLILNLVVPANLPAENLQELFITWWPQLLTYFMGFVILGVLWVGHHNLIALTKHVDRKSVWINIAFFSFVVLIPFTTAILRIHYDAQVAIIAYGLNLIICGIVLLWFWAHAEKQNLTAEGVTPDMVSLMRFRIVVPMTGAVFVTALAFVSPTLSLFLFALLFLLIAVPTNSDSVTHWIAHQLHLKASKQ